jgi:hypothetical protein
MTVEAPAVRMCRMAAYTISEGQVERLISDAKRGRLRVAIVASVALVAVSAFFYRRPDLLRASHSWVFGVIGVICVQPVVSIGWNWSRWPRRQQEAYSKVQVEISSHTIRIVDAMGRDIRLNASEITRAEDRSWTNGLWLRTRNRYRQYLLPRMLDGFAAMKQELVQMGIPVVELRFPPNWEEFVGVAAYCGTMLCVLFTRNSKILAANVLLAALVSACAFYVIRANPDTPLRGPRLVLAAGLPTICAAGALWFSVHPW